MISLRGGNILRIIAKEPLVTLVLAGVIILVIRYYNSTKQKVVPPVAEMEGALASVGVTVHLKGRSFDTSPITIILVTSPNCPYCVQSKSFHSALSRAAVSLHRALYVAIPDLNEGREYLRSSGLNDAHTIPWTDLNTRVPGTPTILAVDTTGTVKKMWVGRLPVTIERDVLGMISAPEPFASLNLEPQQGTRSPGLSLRNLREMERGQEVQILDVHERGDHRVSADAVVMPLLEIAVRAPFELKKTALQAVDCSSLMKQECDAAVEQ